MPGESAEQWRGEGYCERIPLDDLIDLLPHYTIASMVSSKRIEREKPEILEGIKSDVSTNTGRNIFSDTFDYLATIS